MRITATAGLPLSPCGGWAAQGNEEFSIDLNRRPNQDTTFASWTKCPFRNRPVSLLGIRYDTHFVLFYRRSTGHSLVSTVFRDESRLYPQLTQFIWATAKMNTYTQERRNSMARHILARVAGPKYQGRANFNPGCYLCRSASKST